MQKKLNSFLRKEIDKIKSVQFIEQIAFESIKDLSTDEYYIN